MRGSARERGTATVGIGFAYTFALSLPRISTLLMTPILTAELAPAEYGRLALALAVGVVAAFVMPLGLDIALLRDLVGYRGAKQELSRHIGSMWTVLIVWPLAVAVVVGGAALVVLGQGGAIRGSEVALALLATALLVGATAAPMAVLRSERRVGAFVGLNALAAVGSAVVGIVLLVGLHLGVTGWLVALVVANGATLVAAVIVTPYIRPRPFTSAPVRAGLKFSLPLVPHYAAMWAIQLADRLAVAAVLGIRAAGLYSLASNLASPMAVAATGMSQAFGVEYARAGKAESSPNASSSFRGLIRLQVEVVVILCLAWSLLSPLAVTAIAPAEYAAAAHLVAWVVLGYGFFALYGIPSQGMQMTYGYSRAMPFISLTAAVVNVGLVVLFGSSIGLVGVAQASAASYALLMVLAMGVAMLKKMSLPYPWSSCAVCAGVALLAYAGATVTSGVTEWGDAAIRCCWLALAAALTWSRLLGVRGPRGVEDLRSDV